MLICRSGLAAIVLVLWAPKLWAGAWTLPAGEGQAITAITYYELEAGTDDRGVPLSGNRYQRAEIAPYLEYGLTDWLTLGSQPRYQWARAGSGVSKESAQGFGDIDVFARVRLWSEGPWVVSGQAMAVLADAYEGDHRPAPGTGRSAYEARALLGRSLSRGGWSFLNLEAAYRKGTGGVADQFRTDVNWGVRPWEAWMLLMETSTITSVNDGDGRPGSAFDAYGARMSMVHYFSPKWALQVGYGVDFVGEDTQSQGQSAILKIWASF